MCLPRTVPQVAHSSARDGLVLNRARARFGTRAECPKPCLGTEHGLGHANALSQAVPGHGFGHSVCVPNRAWGLGTVRDTRWPCRKLCLVPVITMIDSTSGHGSGQSYCVPFCARPDTVWDRHGLEDEGNIEEDPAQHHHAQRTSVAPKMNWRKDWRCGGRYTAESGKPAECDPDSTTPCCSTGNWCGSSEDHCTCDGCVDFSDGYRNRPGL
ncbi:hypothetical protein Bbelb_155230 [Branchiostoma belcheri]|nr:hypothetical protein Bbelb_155230 [Branchiostoma belcheri]